LDDVDGAKECYISLDRGLRLPGYSRSIGRQNNFNNGGTIMIYQHGTNNKNWGALPLFHMLLSYQYYIFYFYSMVFTTSYHSCLKNQPVVKRLVVGGA
jgi:hypothetical protein